jgi:hypothetical protein
MPSLDFTIHVPELLTIFGSLFLIWGRFRAIETQVEMLMGWFKNSITIKEPYERAGRR